MLNQLNLVGIGNPRYPPYFLSHLFFLGKLADAPLYEGLDLHVFFATLPKPSWPSFPRSSCTTSAL